MTAKALPPIVILGRDTCEERRRWRTPTILIGDPDRPDMILREPSDEELLGALGLA